MPDTSPPEGATEPRDPYASVRRQADRIGLNLPDRDRPVPPVPAAEGTVRRHVYEGERCRFCGVNQYDQALYGDTPCVERAPIVHTSESPVPAAEDDAVEQREHVHLVGPLGDAEDCPDILAGAGRCSMPQDDEPDDGGWDDLADCARYAAQVREACITLAAERDEARQQVADLRAEAERHALANDGCVPGAAYRDLSVAHADLRARIEALAATADRHGSVTRTEVRAALAEGGQPDERWATDTDGGGSLCSRCGIDHDRGRCPAPVVPTAMKGHPDTFDRPAQVVPDSTGQDERITAETVIDVHMRRVAHRVMDVFEQADEDALAEEVMASVFAAIGLSEAFADRIESDGRVYGSCPERRPDEVQRCTCANDGSAITCPFHTQADFDAADRAIGRPAPVVPDAERFAIAPPGFLGPNDPSQPAPVVSDSTGLRAEDLQHTPEASAFGAAIEQAAHDSGVGWDEVHPIELACRLMVAGYRLAVVGQDVTAEQRDKAIRAATREVAKQARRWPGDGLLHDVPPVEAADAAVRAALEALGIAVVRSGEQEQGGEDRG